MSDEQKAVDYLKRALVDLNETRRRLQEAENRATEPIAIVGIACRYPGGVTSPEELWDLVAAGREGVTDLPEDRGWDLESLQREDDGSPPRNYRGGFVQASDLDAEFFGLQEHEALMMDPQHRLLLETAWEACEDAGLDPTALRGSNTGVFVGLSVQSYGTWLLGSVEESVEGYITSGNSGSMASGRLAHIMGLEGPAVSVDTACSSSGTALHLACQSLRLRECSMAITGGVTIMSTPWMYLEFHRQSQFPLSSDGRCKSFADGADGATFSEGVATLVLERLSDAQRLGHDVLAVIRGSSINQDGPSNGLTAPNGLAHERVIREALSNAGLSADQIDVVEGHGMGTVFVDPIEAQALIAAYGRDRDSAHPLRLGAIKSNIGHTQAASTLAGVIKMVMAMRHEMLPKTLHIDAPTRHVDWSSGTVSLLVEPQPWKKDGGVRRAAVHALGISGTNVHIILEEPTPAEAPAGEEPKIERGQGASRQTVTPWILSGRGENGLRRQAQHLLDFVAAQPELDVFDVGYSLVVSRAALSHRGVLVGADREELLAGLRKLVDGGAEQGVISGVSNSGRGDVVFVVASGGGQWADGALALCESSPVFDAELGRIDEALSGLVDWSLRDVLRKGSSDLERPGVAGLLDFAVAVSLVELWKASGVKPAVLVGHGSGEIAAVFVAGALTLDDALRMLVTGDLDTSSAGSARSSDVPLWSASTGELVDPTKLAHRLSLSGAEEPSKLDETIQALRAQGYRAFVEVSVSPLVSQSLGDETVVVPATQRDQPGLRGTYESLGRVWAAGASVDWRAVFAGTGPTRVRLPTYAFDRRRYWPERSPIWDSGGVMKAHHLRDQSSSTVGQLQD